MRMLWARRRLPGAFTLPRVKSQIAKFVYLKLRPSALARMLGLSADARQAGEVRRAARRWTRGGRLFLHGLERRPSDIAFGHGA